MHRSPCASVRGGTYWRHDIGDLILSQGANECGHETGLSRNELVSRQAASQTVAGLRKQHSPGGVNHSPQGIPSALASGTAASPAPAPHMHSSRSGRDIKAKCPHKAFQNLAQIHANLHRNCVNTCFYCLQCISLGHKSRLAGSGPCCWRLHGPAQC